MLSRHVTTIAGDKVFLRPLTVEDATLYPDFLADVTAEDLRLRFFAPMRQVNPDLIDKLIHYDPKRAMAFVAIDDATGKLLGVVRLHDDADGTSGEFAILLRSNLKGHGIGWLLMKHMIVNAKAKGLRAVRGQVMTENSTMLQMCGELGFHAIDDPLERGVKDVTLPLDELPAEAVYFP
ncbi:GNAT family N-acetyltransferase [Pseudolabrys taiwanensis]|nr:GNAT family N-acetyltransferase [Pseudolabrys taiwanensis]